MSKTNGFVRMFKAEKLQGMLLAVKMVLIVNVLVMFDVRKTAA